MPDLIQYLLKRQDQINSQLASLIPIALTYIVILEVRNHKQNKKIRALQEEMKELKHVKGE